MSPPGSRRDTTFCWVHAALGRAWNLGVPAYGVDAAFLVALSDQDLHAVERDAVDVPGRADVADVPAEDRGEFAADAIDVAVELVRVGLPAHAVGERVLMTEQDALSR